MMTVRIQPSIISGSIISAASKSSMQRACAAAFLHDGDTEIINPGTSNDDLAALDVIQSLGAVIVKRSPNSIVIKGGIKQNSAYADASTEDKGQVINCGESGLGIRMFAPVAALSSQQITINGTGSLLTRPMNFFDAIFPKLGIQIESNNGKLPIKIKGPLQPSDITIDGSLSS
ncbi:MAG: 3-phosphoshikimate 1-carboxyvinyltransferase, partial [Ferruginibacter sp.]